MKSGSQPTALTLPDPRQGHIAFRLQNFTLAAESVFSERSNYFNVRWIKTGSGTSDLDLVTFSFSSPILLFAAPYQDILPRSQEPISGVCVRFHAEFLCIETHHEAVGCNGVLFNNVYGVPMACLAPEDERAFDAIVEQMQGGIRLRGPRHLKSGFFAGIRRECALLLQRC
jgi:AraC family transcriptional regulator, transcriptional activator of pobA